MAYFAKLGVGNKVLTVTSVSNDIATTEQAGSDFLNDLYGTRDIWKQTSYSGSMRKNYASVGYTYDAAKDAFVQPIPYPSWVLNEDSCQWEAPIAYPSDGNYYTWDEFSKEWDFVSA